MINFSIRQECEDDFCDRLSKEVFYPGRLAEKKLTGTTEDLPWPNASFIVIKGFRKTTKDEDSLAFAAGDDALGSYKYILEFYNITENTGDYIVFHVPQNEMIYENPELIRLMGRFVLMFQ